MTGISANGGTWDDEGKAYGCISGSWGFRPPDIPLLTSREDDRFPSGRPLSGVLQVYLHPGEVYLARGPAILKTLLGSCVGVTFWSPRLRAGALCHGMLPKCPARVSSPEGYRYVDFAIRDLVRRFELLGATREEIEVHVFGGADMFPALPGSQTLGVGQANRQAAVKVLEDEGLNALASDLGGSRGRTIRFHTWDGRVFLRRICRS